MSRSNPSQKPPDPPPTYLWTQRGVVFLLAGVVLVCALPMVIELGRALFDAINGSLSISMGDVYLRQDRIVLMVRSILIASGIGLIGVCMGIPLAKVLGSVSSRKGRALSIVLISPLMLPSMMLYAAGNVLRAPDTIVGHALIAYSTSSEDLRWVTIWAGYAIATMGLAIWSAPIASVFVASGLGFRSSVYDEMIKLEPVGCIGRGYLWVRVHLRVLMRAWVLITILMLGSAVPMHLAQLDTWSIVIWRQLAETAPKSWGTVWVSAYPMVIAGGVGAWILTRSILKKESNRDQDRGYQPLQVSKKIKAIAIAVWALGTILPLVAMLVTLDDFKSLIQFWHIESGAMRDSGLIALMTGVFTMGIALLVAIILGNPSVRVRRVGAMSVFVLCVLGLIPGVLIGAAIARFPAPWLMQGWFGAVFASCIRAAFLGAIIGALAAASETQERQSSRWQMAGGALNGWFYAVFPSIRSVIIGSGIVGGVYALYEIEASVMVRPPGMSNLPQQLLSDLHYARLEQLSAAGVNLLVIGLIASIVGAALISKIKLRSDLE